jgi:hypothetical protein
MIQIFGHFSDEPINSEEYLILGFSPSSIPLRQRWRNNGLSADFLADYMTTFFPTRNAGNDLNQQVEIKGAVSYIANELLENAMKFTDPDVPCPISIQLQLHSDLIVFCVKNSVSPQTVKTFQAFLQKLTSCDPQELYIEQLEHNASDENGTSSGLGILTMVNDYATKVGWKFESHKEMTTVTTMVQFIV